jgi:hypothetical protein
LTIGGADVQAVLMRGDPRGTRTGALIGGVAKRVAGAFEIDAARTAKLNPPVEGVGACGRDPEVDARDRRPGGHRRTAQRGHRR